MVKFLTWIPDCDSHSPAHLDLFLSSDTSICSTMVFPPFGNSDHVVSVSINFPSNSQRDAPFCHIAYDYCCADWDGLCDHLRDVPWEDTLTSVLLLLFVNFVSGLRLELMYILFIVSIRLSHTHLDGFQLLVQLPLFIEITFFVCTNRIILLNLSKVQTGWKSLQKGS